MPEEVSTRTLADTICLAVTIKRWGNSKRIRPGVIEVNADEDMVRHTKRLLKSDAYEAIAAFDRQTYSWLYDISMPSMFMRGIYRIRLDMQPKVQAELVARAEERVERVDLFLSLYSGLVTDMAPGALRALYDRGDYPTEDAVRRAFVMDWFYPEEPWRVSVKLSQTDPETYAAQQERRKDMEEQMWESYRALLRQEVAGLLDDALGAFSPRGDGKKKALRGDCVEKWKRLWAAFQAKDMTDDEELQKLVTQGRELVSGLNADDIRGDDGLRERLSESFSAMRAQVGAMVQDAPVRLIRFGDDEESGEWNR